MYIFQPNRFFSSAAVFLRVVNIIKRVLQHKVEKLYNYQQRLLDNMQGSHSTWKETLNMTEYQEKFCDFK